MEATFSTFRQDQYRAMLARGGRRDTACFESLFDFHLASGEVPSGFREALISLLDWTESKPASPWPLEKLLPYFSTDPVYDRCFLDLLGKHPALWEDLGDLLPRAPGDLEEPAFQAWAGLLLEAGVRESFSGPVGLFRKAPRDDEASRALQAALSSLWGFREEPGFFPFRNQIPFLHDPGLLVFQFLFYGDPDSAGAGDSGGLATLMRDLGSALSQKEALAGVITVCAFDTASASPPPAPLSFPSARHALVRLPLYLAGSGSRAFLPFRALISRALTGFFQSLRLDRLPGRPVFHLRYLDGASEALSRLAGELSIPLVTTLTPDPHRRIFRAGTGGGSASAEERLLQFYRVLVGDRLLERSRAIVGIGKNSVGSSLLSFYPALADPGSKVIRGIDEGIRLMDRAPETDLPGLLCGGGAPFSIEPALAGRPVILNVGRLNPAKGQYNLVRAWAEAELWRTHNLFLIGGDFQRPSRAESEVIGQIGDFMARHPGLKGRIRFQPSTPNEQIRILQAALAGRGLAPYPDIYFCSSIKEEFGISIIEAMGAGMVVLAPLLGGS